MNTCVVTERFGFDMLEFKDVANACIDYQACIAVNL